MIKWLRIFLVMCLMVCMGMVTTLESKAKRVTVEYWSAAFITFYENAKELAIKFNESQSDIYVKVIPAPREEEILMTAVATGEPPDIYGQFSPERRAWYVKHKALVPLDTLPGFKEAILNRVPEEVIKAYTEEDGHIYTVPYNAAPLLLVYNMDMFKEAGIGEENPPQTWEEYKQAMEKLTMDRDGDGKIDLYGTWFGVGHKWQWRHLDFLPLFMSNTNGKKMYTENGYPQFDIPEGIEALELIIEAFKEGYVPRYEPGPAKLFAAEKCGMIFGGGWIVSTLKQEGDPFRYGVSPIPAPRGKQYYTFMDPKNLGILAQSKHKEEAWEFIKFLLTRESDLYTLKRTQQIPIRKNLDIDPVFSEYLHGTPAMREFAKALPYCKDLPSFPEYIRVADLFNTEYTNAINGIKTPKQALDDAAHAIKTYLGLK